MANSNSKKLKFNLDTFRELCTPDLIINIWLYNSEPVHQPTCGACKTYCDYCMQALPEKWEADWEDFESAVDKYKKCDKSFINIGQYSSTNMHLIIDFLKKSNKKN